MDVPNRFNTDYIHLVSPLLKKKRFTWFETKSSKKSAAQSIIPILSDLKASKEQISTTHLLEKIQTLQNLAMGTAEKIKNALVSQPESEQQQIIDILKGTLLGDCLEKINLDKVEEAVVVATTSFRP